jgi:hypothetical protein
MNRPNEYIVDRLNERISDLEQELLVEKSTKTDMIAAEIVLAVVCFCAGCIVGAVYL